MKKKIFGIVAAVMALVACVGVLAGCSNNNENTAGTTEPTQESTTETTTAPVTEEDVIGKIQTVSDSFVNLVVYTATGEVADYVQLDISGLTATEDTDYVYTASTTKYFKVVNGQQSEATREDLAVDVMIAVTTDDKGVQQVFIYLEEDNSGSSDTTEATTGVVA